MINPFENPEERYVVLINGEGEYSLWLDSIQVPEGWTRVYGPVPRQNALDYIEAEWTDMRPVSIRSGVTPRE